MKVNDFYAKNIKLVREIPKLRRCELCLSYSDFTIPIDLEVCNKCSVSLLGRTERQYILSKGFATRFFYCDMCGKKGLYKVWINPYVCRKCFGFYSRRVREQELEIKNKIDKIIFKRK